ncbi:MAG: 2,3-bisphosphoglycerate-independent phosphoglycerate mutase [Pseudomonadota bacterium]|nr:2,3-bisphosphoglycerate-independent phosphoglycerate mutase [Pseudomonadota bacterium]
MSTTTRPIPAVLLILDGWGLSDETQDNAIALASTPVMDRLWEECPHTTIKTSGAAVGLPAGQMGNSEVGHLNIGAGRVVYQEFTRVSRAIRTGSFFSNHTLTDAVDAAISKQSAVHIVGLLSDGGVHSHEKHIHAVVKLAVERGAQKVYVHAFLDGRDTQPKSAHRSLEELNSVFRQLGGGSLAGIIGRFYAMDRDSRWDRVKEAYDMMTLGRAPHTASDAFSALEMAYARGESDEFVRATVILQEDGEPVRMQDNDVIISMNYRSDRAREITRPFIEEDFNEFERESKPELSTFVTLTEYKHSFHLPVAFPPEKLPNGLGEYLSNLGMRQLRIAETEKYAHVTFFFNGGTDQASEGEERILIPSPRVKTYDLKPEMSAFELTDALIDAIESQQFDVIICNYANTDMVGHTGKLDAAIKAVEAVDTCLQRVVAALHSVGGEALITADHGNAEKMLNRESGQAFTAHTTNPVPLIYVGRQQRSFLHNGALSDLAPTLLHIMGLEQPSEMTGRSLLVEQDEDEPVG